MKIEWTRDPPEAPSKDTESLWYWFLKDGEDQLVVSELWPNRRRFAPGWWGPKIKKPRERPPK